MKSVIIVGPSRAGKTTLAKRLSEEFHYLVISLDKLVATFQAAYPQLDIRLNWNRDKTTENIAPFIGHFLGLFSSDDGYFDFEKIASILKEYGTEELKDRFTLIGLVQGQKTADEYVSDFKKYDTEDDWTYNFSEDELREYVTQDAIPFNLEMTDSLEKFGFTIYDTSTERELVFQRIIEDIVRKNGGYVHDD